MKGSKPKPRGLILDLLLAADPQPLSSRDAVAACSLFGISENNARVALARLSSDGLIEAAERGSYQLSARAHELADDVATWRTAEQRVRGVLLWNVWDSVDQARELIRETADSPVEDLDSLRGRIAF